MTATTTGRPRPMNPETREAAELIAGFLRSCDIKTGWQAHQLAGVPGCPIRPPWEGVRCIPGPASVVGGAPHCVRVEAALEAAVRVGLVYRQRSSGRWLYEVRD